jgi:hypothetical protein
VSPGEGWVAGSCCSTGAVSVIMDSPARFPDIYASPNDVIMNMIAAPVVALLKNVDAPVLPKSVWLLPPPKAAPMSAPLPVWSNTIKISAKQTTTCNMISNMVIMYYFRFWILDSGFVGYLKYKSLNFSYLK